MKYVKRFTKDFKWKTILVFTFFTPILGVILQQISVYNELLYHTLTESISVFIGFLIIVILVSMWKHIRSNTLISIICLSVFFTSIVDVFHIISFPGFDIFSNPVESLNLTMTLWIFARLLQASGILVAILVSRYIKQVNYLWIFISFAVVTFFGIIIILLGYSPTLHEVGSGLTTTKIVSEYLIIFIFVLSGFLLYRYKLITNTNAFYLFIVFIVFQAISEFFFTQFTFITDNTFVIGHHFKIISSIIIGYILLRSTVTAPNETLYNEILQQSTQLSKLLKYETLTREITEICSAAIDNDNYINDVLEILGATLQVDHTFVYKHIEDRNIFKLKNWWFNETSKMGEVDDGYEFFVVDSFLEKMNQGITHYSADSTTIENTYERENFIDIGVFAYINEPLFIDGKFYGFAGYNMTTANRETLEDDITLIKSIAKILTQTIERKNAVKEIEYMSNHDELTGSFNRRYFENYIKEVDNSYFPLGIVVIDLNGLKLINDAFGHVAGDEMLKNAVNLLNKNIKDKGTLFRIGGDEFVVMIPKTDSESVYRLFESIEKQCANVLVSSVQLSLAYGVHVRTSSNIPFYEEFKIAEDEMYRMKLMDVPSMRTNAIETILNTLFEKDEYSKDHCTNVSLMTEVLAQKMGFNTNQVSDIKMAGLLHDIGKIIVPTHILKKDDKLTQSEYTEIKSHAEIGYRILSSTKDFRKIADFVLSHHEFYNGKGYPHGLEQEAIPLESRIISVVDAYDAMVSYRSYREKLTKEQAINELLKNKGSQFDPKIVDIFIKNFDEITKVRNDK